MKSRKDQTEVRYPGVMVKVQEYLRQKGSGRVTTAMVVDHVNHTRTTVSSAMATLSRMPDTGLSDVSAGLYNYTAALDKEWVERQRRNGVDVPQPGTGTTEPLLKITHPVRPTPAVIPKRRTTTPVPEEPVVVVSTPRRTPDTQFTRDGAPRQRKPMQRDLGLRVVRWLSLPENKGSIFSIAEVAEGIEALSSSVSVILRQQAESNDWPTKRIMPGTLYTIPLSAAEQDELDRTDPEMDVVVPEVRQPEPEVQPQPPAEQPSAPVQPTPPPAPAAAPEPAPEPVAQADDNMVLLEKLAETVPGKWLTQDADGGIYWLERLR